MQKKYQISIWEIRAQMHFLILFHSPWIESDTATPEKVRLGFRKALALYHNARLKNKLQNK